MVRKIISHVRDQWAGFLALALVLGGGTAYATGAVSGPVDGPLQGTNSVGSKDIIDGQVLTRDLGAGVVTPAKIAPARNWHPIKRGSATTNACGGGATGVFCSDAVAQDLTAPWQNFGAGLPSAAYYVDQLGVVHLQGVVNNPTSPYTWSTTPESDVIFRLPASAAPVHPHIFVVVGRAGNSSNASDLDVAAGRIDVQPNGDVLLHGDCKTLSTAEPFCSASEQGYISLDGISFRRDGPGAP